MRGLCSFISFVAALSCIAPAAAQPVFDLPPPSAGEESASRAVNGIDLDQAAAAFALAKSLSDSDGGKLWGKALYGPIMLVDPVTRAIVTNAPDRERRLTRMRENLYTGKLPAAINLGNTAVEWAGTRWAMIILNRDATVPGGGELLMHECFHRIQPDLGISLAAPDNHHLDTAAGRTWLRLEWRALAAALESDAPLESEALTDALIFRRYRFAQFDDAARDEPAFELNEGLAEYTGIRLGGADPAAQRSRIINALKSYERMDKLTRTFAYASGPAYGALLDDALPRWRQSIGPRTDLAELLRRAARVRLPQPIGKEAEARTARWGHGAILAEESLRETKRAELLAAHRARYVDNRVLIIDLAGAFNFSFEPHTITALDGIGTVYGTLRATGPWGILDAPGGALMIESNRGKRKLIIPAAPPEVSDESAEGKGRAITGDGWTLQLAPGWTLVPAARHGDLTLRPSRAEGRR